MIANKQPSQGQWPNNQRIHLSDEHHAWLKQEAKRRKITMSALLEMLIEQGMEQGR